MSPLARRTPKDRQRGPRTYSPDETREFLMGRTTVHGELLKLGFNVSQATVSRYMPGRGYPPGPGAPSCGTRHLGSVRSVLARQSGYQTSFLLSSAAGSRELSGASPKCGMASVADLSGHRW